MRPAGQHAETLPASCLVRSRRHSTRLQQCTGDRRCASRPRRQGSRRRRAQSEFVPVSELPPADQLPAAPLLITAYAFVWVAVLFYVWTIWRRLNKVEKDMQALARRSTGAVTAGHFIFIPAVLLVGMVLGWILGSRAARDAYAAELRRREERAARKADAGEVGKASDNCYEVALTLVTSDLFAYRPTASRCASTSGSPALMIFACASPTAYLTRNRSTSRASSSTMA